METACFTMLPYAVAAAAGGMTWFLHCWKEEKYQSKLKRRIFCDTFGGMNVGFFLSLPLTGGSVSYRACLAFVLGLSWGFAAQFIREKVTSSVLLSLWGAARGAIDGLSNQPLSPAVQPVPVVAGSREDAPGVKVAESK